MKTQCLLLLSLLLTSILISAQPTLTMANHAPMEGESFYEMYIPYQDTGVAGANVTWDFSNLNIPLPYSHGLTFLTPSALPNASNFPTANVAMGSTFYSATSTGFTSLNFPLVFPPFTDAKDEMRYPFTYGSSYTDSFGTMQTRHDTTFVFTGSITAQSNAYGTLILPDATVDDVLRIKTLETRLYITIVAGVPDTIEEESLEIYAWYKPGIHWPLLRFGDLQGLEFQSGKTGRYLNPVTVGITPAPANELTLSVYPNPATIQTTVYFSVKQRQHVQLTLLNSIGQLTATLKNDMFLPGDYSVPINASTFPTGIYFVKMLSPQYTIVRKFVVQ